MDDKQLLKKLIDDDELENVELQRENSQSAVTGIVTGVPIKKHSRKKSAVRSGRCSCLGKCICITMLVFTLIGSFMLFAAYSSIKYAVEELTIETPTKFPIVDMSEAELDRVTDRIHSFVDDILYEKSDTKDLVIEQDEINGFIGRSDYLRGNLMVTLNQDSILEEFSLPMNVLHLGFGDRYFVGSDYLISDLREDGKQRIRMQMETKAAHKDLFDGPLFFAQLQYLVTENKKDEGKSMLEMYLEKGSFFGQVAPQEFIDEHQNLLEGLYDADDDDVELIRDIISGIQGVYIEENKVTIKAKRHNVHS